MKIVKKSINPADSVQISYQLDWNAVKLRQLKTKTFVTVEKIHKLQYAEDTAFISSSPNKLQCAINAVAEIYSHSGLAINTDKIEILSMYQPFVCEDPHLIRICEDRSSEVQRCISLASTSSGLSHRVFSNRNLAIKTKVSVYMICIYVLYAYLYSCIEVSHECCIDVIQTN